MMAHDCVYIGGRSINRGHSAYSERVGDVDSSNGVYPHKAIVERSIAPYSGAGRVGALAVDGAAVAALGQFIHGQDSQ